MRGSLTKDTFTAPGSAADIASLRQQGACAARLAMETALQAREEWQEEEWQDEEWEQEEELEAEQEWEDEQEWERGQEDQGTGTIHDI